MTLYDIIKKKVCPLAIKWTYCVFKDKNKKKIMNNVKNIYLLSNEEKERIDRVIYRVKEDYSISAQRGLDLIGFIRERYNFQIVEADLPENITGYIMVDDNNYLAFRNFITHRIIVTNSNLIMYENYLQKRRYIIAHEFAHYLLHKQKNQAQFAKRDTGFFNTKEEQEAEYFARSFLMPEKELKSVLSIKNNLSVEQKVEVVKKCFNVSENKARYRMQELGII